VASLPSTGVEVLAEAVESRFKVLRREYGEPRYATAHAGVKVGGRSAPISRSETVRAILGHQNGLDSVRAMTFATCEMGNSEAAATLPAAGKYSRQSQNARWTAGS
jgi:hypothetical protein